MSPESGSIPTLETERLLLRPLSEADVGALLRVSNEPLVRRYLWDDEPVSRARVEQLVAQSERMFSAENLGLFGVRLRGKEELAGFCGFLRMEGMEEPEIAYELAPALWGSGIATEAARACARHAFEAAGLRRVIAGADAPNAASLRVMEKLGMKSIGTINPRLPDDPYYAVYREDFFTSEAPAPRAADAGRITTTTKEGKMNFVLIPGAWMGEWAWEPVSGGLRALGHDVYPLTLSGLADVRDVGLETHVGDVLSVLEESDLRNAVVVGHSYSGVVAGQVADRAPDRVAQTVFVDAFLPHDGKSMLDAFPEPQRGDELRQIAENGGRWPAPDLAGAADGHGLSVEQARWLVERLVDHPGRTVSEPAVLNRSLAEQRATYVECSFGDSDDVASMRGEPNWSFRALRTGHWPMVSAPDELTELLAEVASKDDEE